MENKYNLRSPAVKRLMKEAAELRDPTEHYHAQPLEDNLFEWHFSVRGPPDSDFDGGVYHGRIILPPEYPMKPPSIILLTPNGRFEVGKKICLSISGHHPETWQPSWSIRTALIAIIGFMPTKGEGAIGSLDYTPEERRTLAKKSLEFCCETCGCTMHSALLALSHNSNTSPQDHKAKELAQQINFKAESSSSRQPVENGSEDRTSTLTQADNSTSAGQKSSFVSQAGEAQMPPATVVEEPQIHTATSSTCPLSPRQRHTQQHTQHAQHDQRDGPEPTVSIVALTPTPQQPQDRSHAGSAVLIVVLTLALATLIFRRIYLAHEFDYDL
ncbi:ubiquitin-conjugating enzyme E2 J1 isoform X2 [Parambassis ranga]|uniref:Ubiquitin-conjugating enzyme E2 J1 n=1 Tax=Parambassis ranga TaxID=210632 RepID=A0A6P7HEA0_9TELE|nr:ubiquitin-conjugating enzyme E2 J1 isoform X2 [Parambassis ranga]